MVMLDRMEPNVRIEADGMSTQSTFAMVLANSGRTEDTVISLSRDTKHAESMRICMPEFDRKGGYKAGSAVLNDKGSFSLAPGESKLLFVVAPRTSMTLTGQTDKDEESGVKVSKSPAIDGVQRFWKNMARERTASRSKGNPPL